MIIHKFRDELPDLTRCITRNFMKSTSRAPRVPGHGEGFALLGYAPTRLPESVPVRLENLAVGRSSDDWWV